MYMIGMNKKQKVSLVEAYIHLYKAKEALEGTKGVCFVEGALRAVLREMYPYEEVKA